MSRTITIDSTYSIYSEEERNKIITESKYSVPIENTTTNQNKDLIINHTLPAEFDIFPKLSKFDYSNDHAYKFIIALKNSLLNIDRLLLSDITLSPIKITENADHCVVLEWIFNYFRIFFLFDKKEGDFCGKIMNNQETGEFYNVVKKMKVENYSFFANDSLNYVITLAKGMIYNDG